MPTMSMKLPNGASFRTQSQRRFVFARHTERHGVKILRRSDTLATVQKEYDKRLDVVESGDSFFRTRFFIVDTANREVIGWRGEDDFIWSSY